MLLLIFLGWIITTKQVVIDIIRYDHQEPPLAIMDLERAVKSSAGIMSFLVLVISS